MQVKERNAITIIDASINRINYEMKSQSMIFNLVSGS